MPRIVISLAVAFVLIFGAFFVKHETEPANNSKAILIATQINTLNAPAIAQYAEELRADGSSTTVSANFAYPTATDTSDTQTERLNATEQLSQNLFTQYMSLKESGVGISDTVAQGLADNLLSQTYTTGTSTTYTEKNLIINQNPSRQDVINYGNALGTALSTPLPAGSQTEIDIFQSFAETNDASILTQLSANITRYTTMEKSLLAMAVPKIFAQDHLTIINTLFEIIHDIGVVQTSATDPVGAETALADYQNMVSVLTNALTDEKAIFTSNSITFSAKDGGYLLTK